MNKKQIIVAWIGAAIFVFCVWNPKIPYIFERQTNGFEKWKAENDLSDLGATKSVRLDSILSINELERRYGSSPEINELHRRYGD